VLDTQFTNGPAPSSSSPPLLFTAGAEDVTLMLFARNTVDDKPANAKDLVIESDSPGSWLHMIGEVVSFLLCFFCFFSHATSSVMRARARQWHHTRHAISQTNVVHTNISCMI
jgi:hypothetical protein